MQKVLFSDRQLDDWLRDLTDGAINQVRAFAPQAIQEDPDGVFDIVMSNWELTPATLLWHEAWREDPREIKVERTQFGEIVRSTGYGIAVHVPFTGSSSLFELSPSTRLLGRMPMAQVGSEELIIDVKLAPVTADDFERLFAREQDSISAHISTANAQVTTWMKYLPGLVREEIAKRKESLDTTAAIAATLSVPARPAPGGTRIHIPADRTNVRLVEKRPEPTKSSPAPATEYTLDSEIYEDVVRTVRSVGNSFERLPDTARKFDEEELRDLLLFILNSNYEGSAGGELFNGAGKTDILVRHEDRNAFIGECKIWGGPAAFNQAIDQLLGYTVWRDTKAALIVFIRNKDASAAIDSADKTIRAHGSFAEAAESTEPELRRDYVLRAKDDPTRLITTALLPIVIREA